MPRSARTAPATRPSAGILLTALAVVISTLVLPSPVASADPATGSGSGGSAAASDERDEGSESGSGSGSDSASGSGSDPTDAPAVAAPRITVIGPATCPRAPPPGSPPRCGTPHRAESDG